MPSHPRSSRLFRLHSNTDRIIYLYGGDKNGLHHGPEIGLRVRKHMQRGLLARVAESGGLKKGHGQVVEKCWYRPAMPSPTDCLSVMLFCSRRLRSVQPHHHRMASLTLSGATTSAESPSSSEVYRLRLHGMSCHCPGIWAMSSDCLPPITRPFDSR
jgi:hypothetical protein